MAAIPPPAARFSAVQPGKFGLGQTAPAVQQPAIVAPVAGVTVDAEARAAINALITALEAFGLVAPN